MSGRARGTPSPTSAIHGDTRPSVIYPVAAALAALLLVGACRGSSDPTGKFGTYGSLRVQGVVLSAAGQPLDSVAVSVRAPANYAASYDLGIARTSASGSFDVMVQRIRVGPGTTFPTPDTLTVLVIGADLRDATSPVRQDSVYVLVRVAPPGTPPPISTVTLRMPPVP